VTDIAVAETAAGGGDSPVINPLSARNELATQLVAKLCHDFISPAGAIISGLDLLEDPSAQDMKTEALGLISASAKKMVTLVHFARIAFGAATSAESFSGNDLRKVLDEVFSTMRAELDFAIAGDAVFSKPAARALMNLGMIIGNALPMGGKAQISSVIENDQLFINATATGSRVRLKPEVVEGLAGQPLSDGLSGQWIQPHWLYCVVAEAGGTLMTEIEPEMIKIVISLPNYENN
jgi:histidine phosphotransferase ChpT